MPMLLSIKRTPIVAAVLITASVLAGCQPPDPKADQHHKSTGEPTVDKQLNSSNEAETREGIERAKKKWGAADAGKQPDAKNENPKVDNGK